MRKRIAFTLDETTIEYLKQRSALQHRSPSDELDMIVEALRCGGVTTQPTSTQVEIQAPPVVASEPVVVEDEVIDDGPDPVPFEMSQVPGHVPPNGRNGGAHEEAQWTPPPATVKQTQSGYRGVYVYGKKWLARVQVDGKPFKIGIYDTAEDAALAWDAHQRPILGAGGAYNFPIDGEELGVIPKLNIITSDPTSAGIPLEERENKPGILYWKKKPGGAA
jgi:hypothetical protein